MTPSQRHRRRRLTSRATTEPAHPMQRRHHVPAWGNTADHERPVP